MGHPTQSEEWLEEVSAELSLKEEKDRSQEKRKGMGVRRQHEKDSKGRHTHSGDRDNAARWLEMTLVRQTWMCKLVGHVDWISQCHFSRGPAWSDVSLEQTSLASGYGMAEAKEGWSKTHRLRKHQWGLGQVCVGAGFYHLTEHN